MVFDHSTITTMEEIAISKFKATCLAVLERVRKTGQPVLVTRFGQPDGPGARLQSLKVGSAG